METINFANETDQATIERRAEVPQNMARRAVVEVGIEEKLPRNDSPTEMVIDFTVNPPETTVKSLDV